MTLSVNRLMTSASKHRKLVEKETEDLVARRNIDFVQKTDTYSKLFFNHTHIE